VRAFGLAMHDRRTDVVEPGIGQHAPKIHLAEAQPHVGVERAGFFKVMLQEVENNDSASGFHDSKGFRQSSCRMLGVMQRLAKESYVGFALLHGQILKIAQPVLQILHTMGAGKLGSKLNHLLGVVYRDHFLGATGEQLGHGPLAGVPGVGEQDALAVGEL